MAAQYLSGSFALPYMMSAKFLGGFQTDANDAFLSLPVMGQGVGSPDQADVTAGEALRQEFAGANDSIIMALNAAYSAGGDLEAGQGIDATQFDNNNLVQLELDGTTLSLSTDGVKVADNGITATQIATSVAGDGLSGGGGTALALDLNELTAEVFAPASDFVAFIDADDNTSKKEQWSDIAALIAGDGLEQASGVLAVSVDDSSIEISGDALQVKDSGVTNAMLANDSVTVTAGTGLSGGGEVDLGASTTINIDENSSLTWTGTQKFDEDVLQIKGSPADGGDDAYFALKIEGGMLVLTEQGA